MSEKLQQDHFKVMPQKHESSDLSSPSGELNQQKPDQYLSGRGAQFNTKNKFLKDERTREHVEGIDDWSDENVPTQYLEQESNVVNKIDSPDVGMMYSMNPYTGCEHGCIYAMPAMCRYWGYSAGLDFEERSS
jgi:hypothetical protein